MNIAIVGVGSIGYQLAKRFTLFEGDIVIIEQNPERAEYAREHLDAMVIEGNATDYEILKSAQIDKMDAFVALTRSDEINLLACKLAKKMGVQTTIARVKNAQYLNPNFIVQKEEFGVDLMVQPEQETAKAIVRLINLASSTDSIEFENGKVHFTGIRIDSHLDILRVPLAELGTKYKHIPMRIVAIKRNLRTFIPRGSDFLMKGDQVFFTCNPNYFDELLEIFGKKNVKIEDVMIIGGGQIAYFIAEKLQDDLNIKIIEKDEKKATDIANQLRDTLVIHGDGSDLDLLTLEGLPDMDEFVAITGDDETNIITSIIAKHLKVPRAITLINKNEYLPLSGTLGLDAVVSKQQITVNVIESFIKRQSIANVVELPGIEAEITMYIAKPKSKITTKPLKNLDFPRGAIVGAVIDRNDNLIIPTGDTHISEGDKVLILCTTEQIKIVEKLFK
ncbi:MAG TPA: Trk system potassium transporter TrkA [Candidatus Kapabacteria bacterium]|nr:Trk system potassium transporter TrkA [Candidatus Kapabacteria bacterium]